MTSLITYFKRKSQFGYEKVLLSFMGLFCLIMELLPLVSPQSAFFTIDLLFFNLPFAAISFFLLYSLFLNKPVFKNLENAILSLSLVFIIYLAAGNYMLGYNDPLMRLTWLFAAVAGGYFSSYGRVILLFVVFIACTAAVNFSLPPEKVPHSPWAYLFFTTPMGIAFLLVVNRSVINSKRLSESERSLALKTAELNNILNSLQLMVSYKDENNNLLKVNRKYAQQFDIDEAGLTGKSLYDILPYPDAKRYHEEDLKVLQTGQPLIDSLDKYTVPGSNKELWLSCNKIPYYDENGNIQGLVVSAEDVTTRVMAEQKLRESEERFRMIFENAPVGMMLVVDCVTPFIKVNRSITQLIGYSEEELLKMTPADISHEEDKFIVLPMIAQAKQEGKSFFSLEKRFIHKSGKIIYTFVSLHFVEERGNKDFIVGIIQDITQRKENEKKLEQYARQLEERNQLLQEFAYAASHDLREPLRTVTSYVQLLQRYLPMQSLRPEVPEFMAYIVGGAKRMDMQITALLNYSRVGNSELNFTRFSLAEALTAVCHALQAQLLEHDGIIEIEDFPVLVADRLQMEALLQNLLSNSLKYRKPDCPPHITISATTTEKEWLFAFQDNGIGIENEFLEKIFAVFRRLHTQEQIPGSGVGLAICRRIIQRHGGKIWAASTFGKGTTIYFTLPLHSVSVEKGVSVHSKNLLLNQRKSVPLQ